MPDPDTYAITPKGVGKPVGARCIQPDWPLEQGETFKAFWTWTQVLAEDGASLREGTEQELQDGYPNQDHFR